jgi:hypothetical protein
MTDYHNKFMIIKNDITDSLKKKITDIYDVEECYREFKIDDCIFEMSMYYISKFEEEFLGYIKNHIRSQLECNGRNLGYAIKTYIKLYPDCSINNLDKFAIEFLTTQFDDFDNWCYDLEISYSERQDSVNIQKKTV